MTNTNSALDNYIMWLKNYPGDYKGAAEAASDFIDTEEELDSLIGTIKSLANA